MGSYMPILKLKRGDLKAIEKSEEKVKKQLIPLFEIPDDFNEKSIKLLPDAFFCDGEDENVETLLELASQEGKRGSRVVYDFSELHPGCCYRVDAQEPMFDINEIPFGDDVSEMTLLIDFKDIQNIGSAVLIAMANLMKPLIEMNWKQVFVASTVTPKSMAGIEACTVVDIIRREWELFLKIKKIWDFAQYADYSIHHPEALDGFDPVLMKPAAKIRYTLEDRILIAKGNSFRARKGEQHTDLAKKIIATGAFKGANFSFGDEYLEGCADGKHSGNLESWIVADTNHHMAVVANQLATLHDA